jgi:hypothetical protein
MPGPDKSLSIFALERTILRALCRDGVDSSAESGLDARSRAAAVSNLLSHNWQDAEHRVVFEALTRLPGRDAAELRRQLPAQATRMGFPDVRWETYFTNGAPRGTQSSDDRRIHLETLIAKLGEAQTARSS